MPGTEERESTPVLEETPVEEERESSREPSIEDNRAGFMLLDF